MINSEFNIFSLSVAIIITMCVTNGIAHRMPSQCPIKCPNFTLTINLTNPDEETKFVRTVLPKLWDSKALRPPSCLVTELKNVLQEMLDTDFRVYQYIVSSHAILATTYLSIGVQDINLCTVAQGVNATIRLAESNDKKFVAESLRLLSQQFRATRRIITKSALLAAGCCNADPLETAPSCYKKGMVYPIEKMFKLYGRMLPCPLKEVVMKLYNSENIIDNGHAAVIAATLSPILRDTFGILPRHYYYEEFLMLATPDIPKKCCEDRKTRLDLLSDIRDEEARVSVEKIIKERFTECHHRS